MKELKNLDRKLRVLKLHAIVMAFSQYTQMELHRSLIKHKNDWNDAENTKNLIHFFFPDRELKTEDFLLSKDELSDEVIDRYNEFKSWIPVIRFLGIPEKTVKAFCKNVDNTASIWLLKSTGHLYYPFYFGAIYKYLDGTISKEELKKSFVEYSIFTGKATPVRLRLFRRTIIKIEKLIDEIMTKQAARSGKSVNEFIEDCRLLKQELTGIPF